MGHDPPYTVPDYKTYQVAGCAKLEALEKVLAAKGLKDPWIRNEVWRYNKGFGTPLQRGWSLFFRGLFVGVGLTALTVAYDKTLGGGDHHDHHDSHEPKH